MAEAVFYILPTESTQARYQFVCKFVEKSYRSGFFVYVLTQSVEQSRYFDELLWTFRAGSFVPHQLYDTELPSFENVVLIGEQLPPANWRKMVVNVSGHYPEDMLNTEKVVEILDNNDDIKSHGRLRYQRYLNAGFEMTTHKL